MPPEPLDSVPVISLPAASVPVVSVPVVSGGAWMQEAASTPAPEPTVASFLSDEDDSEADDTENDYFFAASSAPVSSTPAAAPVAAIPMPPEPQFDPDFDSEFGTIEPEMVTAPSRPQFAEMAEEPVYTPLPRDYASDFGSGVRTTSELEDHRTQPATALFAEPGEEIQRDLDTPTFLRRLRF
jgi:hypothetical protein